MKRYIKFCGMRRIEDIEYALELGVDGIGMVMVPESARSISIDEASRIRQRLPMGVEIFALVRDASVEHIEAIYDRVNPNYVQFHGTESAEFCEQFQRPYCKALALADPGLTAKIDEYNSADLLILDGHAVGAAGGSGEIGDWSRYPRSLGIHGLLAGGLRASNVAAAIRATDCAGVDVSSGIESEPGVKSTARMTAFVRNVRALDH